VCFLWLASGRPRAGLGVGEGVATRVDEGVGDAGDGDGETLGVGDGVALRLGLTEC